MTPPVTKIYFGFTGSDSLSMLSYLAKWPFCSITALGSHYNPQNMKYIPAVIMFACLVLKQKFSFFKTAFSVFCLLNSP